MYKSSIRAVFFNTCHLLDFPDRGLILRMLFICEESITFSDQVSIKIIAL